MSELPKRRPGRPRTVDRDAALDAAVQHFWRLGPAAVSVNELVRRIGISKPAMYREFGGEEGLLLASLERYREQILVPRQAALRADLPFGELLDRAIVALTSDQGTPPGCLLTQLRGAPARLGPAVASRVGELEREQRAGLLAWYRGALARGEANAAVPEDLGARYLDTLFTTVLTQMALGRPPGEIREEARLAATALLADSAAG